MFGTPQPLTNAQLRWFGVSIAGAIWTLALIAWWRFNATNVAAILAATGAIVLATYYLWRGSQPVIIGVFRWLTRPIQLVVSILLLGLLYFLVVTPIGLLLRLFGRDPLAKSPDKSQSSYWTRYPVTPDSDRYFRLY